MDSISESSNQGRVANAFHISRDVVTHKNNDRQTWNKKFRKYSKKNRNRGVMRSNCQLRTAFCLLEIPIEQG